MISGQTDTSADLTRSRNLACSEVWGGCQGGTASISLSGMIAWVYSRPMGKAAAGGDLCFLSVCDEGSLSRVVLADVRGHGDKVSGAAHRLHGLMRKYIETWDQSQFVKELNLAFPGDPTHLDYATAMILGFYRMKGRLVFTNAGHPPPLLYHHADRSWSWLEEATGREEGGIAGLPVGMIPGTRYHQTVVGIAPGDLLVLYSDGITEARNHSGEELGREGLREWVSEAPVDSPRATGEVLLDCLNRFRRGLPVDDETLIVLHRIQE